MQKYEKNKELKNEKNNKIPAVIMAGGLGKRATCIDATIPKPLISIAGKPILEWEIECLVRQGYTNIILTVSYMAEKIKAYFEDGSRFSCSIKYYYETAPLGNAGALVKLWKENVFDLWKNENGSTDFLLLNADSMLDVNFDRLVAFHKKHSALATLLVHPNSHPFDSGLIITNSDDIVINWLTKDNERPKYYKNCVNSGVHVLNTKIFKEISIDLNEIGTEVDGKIVKLDLDSQILKPLCMENGKIYAYKSPEYVKDMGTPERFEQVRTDLASGLVARKNLSRLQKAIFLDRDGTINKNVGFLKNIDSFELIPGVVEAIKRINNSGYLCIVITNQPVIARGELSDEELQSIHNKMETLLGENGAYIDGLYYCPHHPDKGFEGEVAELKIDCDCRKPKPGMLLKAARDFNIDLNSSWMIGDGENDILAGINAGCFTAWINEHITTGMGAQAKPYDGIECDKKRRAIPTVYVDNLLEAVKYIESANFPNSETIG